MPYRAMIVTIVTVALALVALGMWVRAVEPILKGAEENDAVATLPVDENVPATNIAAVTTAAAEGRVPQSTKIRWVVQGTLLLSFVLICMLLLVGFAATFREWVRYSGKERERRRVKTAYVDAWKIAGERMATKEKEEGEEEGEYPGGS